MQRRIHITNFHTTRADRPVQVVTVDSQEKFYIVKFYRWKTRQVGGYAVYQLPHDLWGTRTLVANFPVGSYANAHRALSAARRTARTLAQQVALGVDT